MIEYVKYISETVVEYPPRDKGSIINYNINYAMLTEDGFKELIPVQRPETNRRYHIEYVEHEENITETIAYDETQAEADAREAQEERQRLDALTLTPADVERALYKEKQMDFDDLKALIAQQIPQVDIKGLAIEFRAKDFYRGAMASGMRLFDVVGALLGYTPEDMDYLFEHKELPEKVQPEPEPEPEEE